VLCNACYLCFKNRGTLERAERQQGESYERRCTYAGCERPDESSRFLLIKEGTSAGGQDWSGVVGSVLCHACYSHFSNRGTLERAERQQALSRGQGSSHTDVGSKRKRSIDCNGDGDAAGCDDENEQGAAMEDSVAQDEAGGEGGSGGADECVVCLGGGKRMCIVPCGHMALCVRCGEGGEDGRRGKRPFSECPVCREEMCEPYVMDRETWVYLGGVAYDV